MPARVCITEIRGMKIEKPMKAVIHKKYGSPDVLQLTEVPKPIPNDNEVLIKIYATTVNRTDCGFRSAEYFISRFFSGLFKPKNQILGNEFAGVIEATGAIGSAAVQLAKYFGATVTAVCNTKNLGLVKSLGADVVIDYTSQDYTKSGQTFDFVFDAVGKSSLGKCKPILSKNGIYISTELGKNGENVFLALTTPLFGDKKVLFPLPTISREDVEFLKKLVIDGHFKPVIDRRYRLEEIIEATRYVETLQKTGNVVIVVSDKFN